MVNVSAHRQAAIEINPATADRWDEVVAVMGTRGDPSRCWCQYFLLTGDEWRTSTAADNKERLRHQVVAAAHAVGVLASRDGEPVGWCAVAPKRDHPRVVASRVAGPDLDESTWSVTCFVVRVGHRRQGVARALLEGAVAHAHAGGARVIEAYPVDPRARPRISSADLYHGPLELFLGAGFVEVARPSPGRALVRLDLTRSP